MNVVDLPKKIGHQFAGELLSCLLVNELNTESRGSLASVRARNDKHWGALRVKNLTVVNLILLINFRVGLQPSCFHSGGL